VIEYSIYSAVGLLAIISFGFTVYLDNKDKKQDSYTEFDDEKDR